MVSKMIPRGLIVTPNGHNSDLVNELVLHLNWPVMLEPGFRSLQQCIQTSSPRFLLFWLEETPDISRVLRLVECLRDRGPRPYRIAVAHRLEANDEPRIRAAGVHSCFVACGNLANFVKETLLPFIDVQLQPDYDDRALPFKSGRFVRGPTQARASPAEMRLP